MHSFFGSDAVTVNTTTSEELRAGCHTNDNPNDYSVYCMFQTLRPSTNVSDMLTLCKKGRRLCSR
jgi:hypothetical protein